MLDAKNGGPASGYFLAPDDAVLVPDICDAL
jgi:hypothetical protein